MQNVGAGLERRVDTLLDGARHCKRDAVECWDWHARQVWLLMHRDSHHALRGWLRLETFGRLLDGDDN